MSRSGGLVDIAQKPTQCGELKVAQMKNEIRRLGPTAERGVVFGAYQLLAVETLALALRKGAGAGDVRIALRRANFALQGAGHVAGEAAQRFFDMLDDAVDVAVRTGTDGRARAKAFEQVCGEAFKPSGKS